MKDLFDRLRDTEKKLDSGEHEFNSCFESALFPMPPWEIEIPQIEDSIPSDSSEKLQTFKSLEKFVEDSTSKQAPDSEEKKVSFPGGEIAVATTGCEIVHLCDGPAPELSESPILAVFLGDLMAQGGDDEKIEEINGTLTRMIGAMNFSPEEFERKPSLRYFVDENDTEKSKSVIDRFFNYIYKHQIKVVLTFGALDSRSLIGKRERLARIHGKFIQKEMKFSDGTSYSFKIVPVFHPEYLKVNPNMRRTTWEDLQGVMRFFGKL